MKRFLSILVLTLLPFLAIAQGFNSKGGSHRGYQTPYTQQEQQPSSWSGSGIALSSRVFATNNHVVDGATHLYAYFPETKSKYKAETITVDADNDLALVRIIDPNFPGFPAIKYGFKDRLEDVGTDIFVLGYPLPQYMGEEVKLTTGIISARSGFEGKQSVYQISAAIQGGNSGGPVFNDSGELVGIAVASLEGAENVHYAVKVSYLSDLVSHSGEKLNLIRNSQIADQKLSEKCKAIIPCTVMVLGDNQRDGQSGRASSYGAAGTYPIRVNTPDLQEQNTQTAGIVGIEIGEKGTSVYMAIVNPYNRDIGYSIAKDAYIKDNATGKKYVLKGTENIEIAPKKSDLPAGYQADFVLYFPPIPASVTSIDLCEPGDSGWQFKGIQIQ